MFLQRGWTVHERLKLVNATRKGFTDEPHALRMIFPR